MDKLYNFNLINNNKLSRELLSLGISNFNDALNLIQKLPYGRNSNRSDFNLIVTEQKGTCSTKHAYLASLAELHKKQDVKLFIGIYKMTEENTSGVSDVLKKWQLPYIPEAHCYLKINQILTDITRNSSSDESFEKSLLFEEEILTHQIGDYKINRHQEFIRNWILSEAIHYDFETIWHIREACIKSLSEFSK